MCTLKTFCLEDFYLINFHNYNYTFYNFYLISFHSSILVINAAIRTGYRMCTLHFVCRFISRCPLLRGGEESEKQTSPPQKTGCLGVFDKTFKKYNKLSFQYLGHICRYKNRVSNVHAQKFLFRRFLSTLRKLYFHFLSKGKIERKTVTTIISHSM